MLSFSATARYSRGVGSVWLTSSLIQHVSMKPSLKALLAVFERGFGGVLAHHRGTFHHGHQVFWPVYTHTEIQWPEGWPIVS